MATRFEKAYFLDNGKAISDVLSCKPVHFKKRNHPIDKPEDLLAQLIEVTIPLGGTVIDMFMGGGSTGMAALQCGRKFIGIELDVNHFENACDRIKSSLFCA